MWRGGFGLGGDALGVVLSLRCAVWGWGGAVGQGCGCEGLSLAYASAACMLALTLGGGAWWWSACWGGSYAPVGKGPYRYRFLLLSTGTNPRSTFGLSSALFLL